MVKDAFYAAKPLVQRLKNHCCTLPKTVTKIFYFYFHVNGSIGIDFEIRSDLGCTTLKTSRNKVVLDNPSVCLSVCLTVAFPASSHGRKGKPIELKL